MVIKSENSFGHKIVFINTIDNWTFIVFINMGKMSLKLNFDQY